MTVQLEEKSHHSKPATAGPSADDRFGAGPIATNAEARIIKGDIVGGRTRITIARGAIHGVRTDMEGHVTSGGQTIATFQIDQVKPNVSYAFIDATIDRLDANAMAVINPTRSHAPPTHELRSRVIHVQTDPAGSRITIARGSDHGIHRGMRGTLVSNTGAENYRFTIELVDGNRSYATVETTVAEVNNHPNVVLRPLHAKHAAAIQRRATGSASTAEVQATADAGVASASSRLPHFDTIQRAFGKHDISNIQSQVGGAATPASASLGAQAYATGNRVAFASSPDLHTAAHEAAHTIQQRHGAVGFQGLGAADDEHEHHADAVADAVVAGQSAEPLLDQIGKPPMQVAPTGQVQLKPDGKHAKGGKMALDKHTKGDNKPDDKPTRPTEIDAERAYEHLKEGQDARHGLKGTKVLADRLYSVVLERARLQRVGEEHKQKYEAAKAARKKMLEKSKFEQVLTAITTMIEFGVALYSLIGAAKKVMDGATALRHAYKTYNAEMDAPPVPGIDLLEEAEKQVWKTGKHEVGEVVKGGKSGKDAYDKAGKLPTGNSREALDPDTVLPDINAEAIQAGNAALQEIVGDVARFDLDVVRMSYEGSALNLKQMKDGVELLTKANKVMPDESLKEYGQLLSQCETAAWEVQASLKKLEDVWKAFDAGGAEALDNPRERGLFETVQAWTATGNFKTYSLHLAMDQANKSVRFSGTSVRPRPVSAFMSVNTSFHNYEERTEQAEQGTLYVTDQEVAKELVTAGLIQRTTSSRKQVGTAEKLADKIGGEKFSISISMCKALISLGVRNNIVDASVILRSGSETARITKRHRGDWYEKDWMNTDEFATFWRQSLGAKYAFVGKYNSEDELRKIDVATPEEVRRSEVSEATGLANPRKRE